MSTAAARAALFGGTSNTSPAPSPTKKKTLDEVLKEGDWVEKKDEKSGKNYYYNKKTKQTTWDLVKELKLDPSTASTSSASSAPGLKTVADVLKDGEWVEKKDEKSGKSYYYNKKTKKTTWDLAKELGLSTSSASQQQQKQKTVADVLKEGEWVEKKDDKSGKSYYYNKKTKKTTWDLAKELGLSSSSNNTKPKKKTLADVLKEGDWVEKKDEKSGKTYYYNKKTRKTTWDLVKELDLAKDGEGDGEEEAAAKKKQEEEEEAERKRKQQEEEERNRGPPKTVAEALARGEWMEKVDPKSGRKFYVNKNTKKTTWNLAKELGIEGADTNEEFDDEGNKKSFKPPTGAELLAKGIWRQVKDYRGLPYYIKTSTGESCADLDLYLKIKFELEGPAYFAKDNYLTINSNLDPNSSSQANANVETVVTSNVKLSSLPITGPSDEKNYKPTAEARRQAGQGISQLKEWVDFFTQTHNSDESERKLLSHVTKREIEDARQAVMDAKQNEDVLRKQLSIRDQEITNLRSLLSIQNKEVQQLQCALFYGLGSSAYNQNAMHSANNNAAAGNNHHNNQHYDAAYGSPMRQLNQNQQNNNNKNILLPPAPLDAMIARDEHHPENVSRKIATLERLVFDLQAHNRTLLEQLKLSQEGKHRHSECSQCQEHDPWQRLLSVAHSPSRTPRM